MVTLAEQVRAYFAALDAWELGGKTNVGLGTLVHTEFALRHAVGLNPDDAIRRASRNSEKPPAQTPP